MGTLLATRIESPTAAADKMMAGITALARLQRPDTGLGGDDGAISAAPSPAALACLLTRCGDRLSLPAAAALEAHLSASLPPTRDPPAAARGGGDGGGGGAHPDRGASGGNGSSSSSGGGVERGTYSPFAVHAVGAVLSRYNASVPRSGADAATVAT